MSRNKIPAIFSSCLLALFPAFASFAQESAPVSAQPPPNAPIPQPDNPPAAMQAASSGNDVALPPTQHDFLSEALNAPPPRRAAYAQKLASPQKLADIDAWIRNTPDDHPQNLMLKDILAAMPPAISGPRIVALAQKSRDPDIRDVYARYLAKYPKAYAAVLYHWMKQNDGNTVQMLRYLGDYAAINPQKALDIWAQLRMRHPVSELGGIATFGLHADLCAASVLNALRQAGDEISKLRAARALIQCDRASSGDAAAGSGTPASDAGFLKSVAGEFYASKLPSRRIVALDLYARFFKNDEQILATLKNHYDGIKNSTEKRFALLALESLDPDAGAQNRRLLDALRRGDEILRLTASECIAKKPEQFDTAVLQEAFKKEIWPEIQAALYEAMRAGIADPGAQSALRESILRDPTRTAPLREKALRDIAETAPQKLNFALMAQIQNETDPRLDLIASLAEILYRDQPQTRRDLRSWLKLQAPFPRRLMTTFARFVQIDKNDDSDDRSVAETMMTICGATPIQDGIIRTCIDYFDARSNPSDEEKAVIGRLKARQNQIDLMLGFEL